MATRKLPTASTTAIHTVLSNLFEANTMVSWKSIVAKVGEYYTVENWLKVRGVLQHMINTKAVARTSSITEEIYTAI